MINERFALLAAGVLVTLGLAGCTPSDPGASPSASDAAASSQTPTPPPMDGAPVDATCDNTITDAFRAEITELGWVSWPNDNAVSIFDQFPDGAPEGTVICTWGEDPAIGTDNVVMLAWAPLDAGVAAATQDQLVSVGYERIEAPEGVFLAMRGADGWADEEGFSQTFLFTEDDVRWAMYKDEVRYVKAPDEPAP